MVSSQHRKYLFQNISHGGSRDALVHLLPMEPSAKELQDSDRGEPPNGVRMFVPGNEFLCFFEFGNPQCCGACNALLLGVAPMHSNWGLSVASGEAYHTKIHFRIGYRKMMYLKTSPRELPWRLPPHYYYYIIIL